MSKKTGIKKIEKETPRQVFYRLFEKSISEEELAAKIIAWFHSGEFEKEKFVFEQFIGRSPQGIDVKEESSKEITIKLVKYMDGVETEIAPDLPKVYGGKYLDAEIIEKDGGTDTK